MIVAGAAVAVVACCVGANWWAIYYALVPEARMLGAWQVDTKYLTFTKQIEFVPDLYFRRGGKFLCKSPLLALKIGVPSDRADDRYVVQYRVEGNSIVYSATGLAEERRTYRVINADAIEIGGIRYRRVRAPATLR